MKERAILFNGEMVRAVLDGRKTQTRRVVKTGILAHSGLRYVGMHEDLSHVAFIGEGSGTEYDFKNPYGQIGDRLWVREAWKPDDSLKGGGIPRMGISYGDAVQWKSGNPDQSGPWKPSIHMPRWASRILLETVDVRVERVRDISVGDIEREGLVFEYGGIEVMRSEERELGLPLAFEELWDSINAKRGFGWDVNPWVWVVEFKVITT